MHKYHGLNPDIKSTLCVHNYACVCVDIYVVMFLYTQACAHVIHIHNVHLQCTVFITCFST